MKKQPPTPLLQLLTRLVKQTRELCRRATGQFPAWRETADGPSAPQARSTREATSEAGQEAENVPPPDRVADAGMAATDAGARPDDQPAGGGAMEPTAGGPGQILPSSQATPGEQTENAVRPDWPGAGRDFRNRLDAAQSRIGNQAQSDGDLQALLDHAIALLESVSQHPAMRDWSAHQRKLEEIEQRLNSSGNVQ